MTKNASPILAFFSFQLVVAALSGIVSGLGSLYGQVVSVRMVRRADSASLVGDPH
jgi:hypothetical protein